MNLLRFWCLAVLFGLVAFAAPPTHAHPMGNFSINHYARFEAKSDGLWLRYILDYAEIPAADRMPQLDSDGNGAISALEKSAFLSKEATTLLNGLSLRINSQPVALVPIRSDLEVRAGAGGLPTLRVWTDARVALPANGQARVTYRDSNFEGRTGWMEIIAVARQGRAIRDSNASSTDQSRGLTVFPIDAGVVPPRQSEAAFSVVSSSGASQNGAVKNDSGMGTSASASKTNDQTPQNGFTQSIAERKLTPGLMLGGMLVALAFGAVHALSPGHGKTMVAAYLVGTRGTTRHAVLLGLVVTITHTFGVFALGMGLLFASQYILPERLFPALSALSGLLVFGVGLWLFITRWQGLTSGQVHDHHHGDEEHSHAHDDDGHSHSHDEEHGHSHAHDGHTHSHGAHVHSHGGRAHSHAVPEGPVTMKTLVALGISGGIVPCPEALVVLLAAVKLHRIGYGLLLITTFSIGLAAALIAIGLVVVAARRHMSRFDKLGEGSALVRFLPIGSAAIITLIGAGLTLSATGVGR